MTAVEACINFPSAFHEKKRNKNYKTLTSNEMNSIRLNEYALRTCTCLSHTNYH